MNFYLLDDAAADASAAQQQNPANLWIMIGMYVILGLAIYFFIFRPNKKKKRLKKK